MIPDSELHILSIIKVKFIIYTRINEPQRGVHALELVGNLENPRTLSGSWIPQPRDQKVHLNQFEGLYLGNFERTCE